MPVLARRPLRRMRGGAQAFLMEAADGHHYVVKFSDNPQHRRVLVNEYVASILLSHLDIAQPETRVIEVSADLLRDHPDVYIQLGASRRPVTPGWHFGSCHPGDPNRLAIYDFIPDALLHQVANAEQFRAVRGDRWNRSPGRSGGNERGPDVAG